MDAVIGWIMGIFAAIWPGEMLEGTAGSNGTYYGYVEADYKYIAPAHGGTLAEVAVREGQLVGAGALLFRQSSVKEQADLAAAMARANRLRARLDDSLTGQRPEEIAVIADTLSRAQADLDLAISNFKRTKSLVERGVISNAQYDKDQSNLDNANARLREIKAQMVVAQMPARPKQVRANEQELKAAEADADKARALLRETTTFALEDAVVERVFFDPGEQIGPSQPVVSLLTAGQMKAKFFVPQNKRSKFGLGTKLSVSCDGCVQDVLANVSRLAAEPEFAPPVIYSRDERSRMVFMVEARITLDDDGNTGGLQPGQPITVRAIK